MKSPIDWNRCQTTLESLLQHIEAAHEAALLSSPTEADADQLAQRAQALSQAMTQATPELGRWLEQADEPLPAHIVQLLEQVKTRLGLLQDHTARLGARNQQALGVLFPQSAADAYSRLGKKY
jgi:hypothetical protein